jgi:hypothetical protein
MCLPNNGLKRLDVEVALILFTFGEGGHEEIVFPASFIDPISKIAIEWHSTVKVRLFLFFGHWANIYLYLTDAIKQWINPST